MRAPDFWWSAQPGLFNGVCALLAPARGDLRPHRRAPDEPRGGPRERAGGLRRQFRRRRRRQDAHRDGGRQMAQARRARRRPFLSRGYGGALSADGSAHLVDRRKHCAAETGDEPLLLARIASTVVARDRPTGALLALAGGASLIVMDDGLQNPSLARDFTLAVIDGGVGFGNGRLIPAGPLRAPLHLQLEHTDAGLVIGEGAAGVAAEKIFATRASRCSTAGWRPTRMRR